MNYIGTGYTKGEETFSLVEEALKNGYFSFDCASLYSNEREVGNAIKESNIDRSQLKLISKCSYKCLSKQDVYNEFEETLSNLQTEYIDIYLCHWPNGYERNAIVWEAIEELYYQGKIKQIGVSNFQIHHFTELLKTARIVPMYNQVELHPLLQQFQLQDYCNSHNIKLMAYGTLSKGKIFENKILLDISKQLNSTIPVVVSSWLQYRGIDAIIRPMNSEQFTEMKQIVKINDDLVKKIKFVNTGTRLYSDPDNMIFDR